MVYFRWLHFTDLHVGHPHMGDRWPNVEQALYKDLDELIDTCGPWDLVLFTGDLVQTGAPAEYERATQFIDRFLARFCSRDCGKLFFAVPGNHDLARPANPKEPALLNLLRLWDDVQDSFWAEADSPYRVIVRQAFNQYAQWWDKMSRHRPVHCNSGILPGDFSSTIEKDGIKLGVLGLNSTFLQLVKGVRQKDLAIHVRQFNKACNEHGPDWADSNDICVLMTHHPPDWLTPDAMKDLDGEIHQPERFALHLFGHMHEANLTSFGRGGMPPRLRLQGPSLFGLEEWGEDERQKRSHGYSLCQLKVDDHNTELRVWPRVLRQVDRGFVRDQDNFQLVESDGGMNPISISQKRKRRKQFEGPAPMFGSHLKLPEMVQIPRGTFLMGTNIDVGKEREKDITLSRRYEGPQIEITIDYEFEISKYPITYVEWDCFVQHCQTNAEVFTALRQQCKIEGIHIGLKLDSPPGYDWGRGRLPVVNVSWYDANVYVRWLNMVTTGAKYRLLTEAEWEYCCRGGATTEYWFGDQTDETKTNYGLKYGRPLEVGFLYGPNPFELWDMSGQVWEWVGDPWHPSHMGRPQDGALWRAWGFSDLRVVRGGSWKGSAASVRSASRSFQVAEHRVDNVGLRLARNTSGTKAA